MTIGMLYTQEAIKPITKNCMLRKESLMEISRAIAREIGNEAAYPKALGVFEAFWFQIRTKKMRAGISHAGISRKNFVDEVKLRRSQIDFAFGDGITDLVIRTLKDLK